VAVFAVAHPQVFSPVASFDGINGGNARAMTLVQGLDGNLYGTTWEGGTGKKGVVFKLNGSTITLLHTFTGAGTDGSFPNAGLVLGTNGKFYGTTEMGGAGAGSIFRIASAGAFATLHSFTGPSEGATPEAPLIQGSTGAFYGTTQVGFGGSAGGTLFKMTAVGAVTTLHSFLGPPTDGLFPFAPLVQASDGSFYGTTEDGGVNPCNCGMVFQMTPAGKVKILFSFKGGNDVDGAKPDGGLVEGLDHRLYGTTTQGGAAPTHCGTVFAITTAGVLTTLHSFAGYPTPGDGCVPEAGLTLGSDGNLYGTTFAGGSKSPPCNCGTVFQIAPDGTFRTLYSFTNGTDGRNPWGGLVQATNGLFYGTTIAGGAGASSNCVYDSTQTCGTVFSLNVGLPPFVTDLPRGAKVGKVVKILGNNLGAASAVSFNGTSVAFSVVSATQIKTKVPPGATTGYVTVTTPGGTLSSNVPFRVLP